VNPPGQQADTKFEQEDLPKIHAALEIARKAKAPSKLTVDLAESGGVISVLLEIKKKFK
jgi:hypothetical protein